MSRAKIAKIDRAINAVRRELRQLETIDPLSSESWQAAWDRHPDLRARSDALWLQRGYTQIGQVPVRVKAGSTVNRRKYAAPTVIGALEEQARQMIAQGIAEEV